MKTSSIIGLVVLLVVIVGSGIAISSLSNDAQETADIVDSGDPYDSAEITGMDSEIDTDRQEVTSSVLAEMKDMRFTHEGSLEDVMGGSASGVAMARYQDGEYLMKATFEELPPLEDGFFYEGWVVRRGENMSVISTGATTVENGVHQNVYRSEQNLLDHDFYVLTLEPDDGDPAPAEHVVEGTMVQVREAAVESTQPAARSGSYVEYDEARFVDAEDGTVVLFFHAAWCPTCRAADKDIVKNAGNIPNGLTILKTDYDEYDDLKSQYGVTYQHTFVEVDAEGNKLQVWNGGELDEIVRRVGLN